MPRENRVNYDPCMVLGYKRPEQANSEPVVPAVADKPVTVASVPDSSAVRYVFVPNSCAVQLVSASQQ